MSPRRDNLTRQQRRRIEREGERRATSTPQVATPSATSTTPSHPGGFIPVFILALIVIGLAVWSSSLGGAFVFDDEGQIVENARVHSLNGETLSQMLHRSQRWLTDFTFAVQWTMHGDNPRPFHIANAIIHVLATLTLFGLVRRTLLRPVFDGRFASTAPVLAFAIALVWMVHPLQTESVTYIVQRAESLMGLLSLFTLYALLRGAEAQERGDRAAASMIWYGISLMSCIAALLAKPVAVTLPIAVVLYDLCFLARSLRRTIGDRRWYYAPIAATLLFALAWFLPRLFSTETESTVGLGFQAVTPWQYARTQPEIILHYLRLSYWPNPLVIDYLWWPTPAEQWWRIALTGVLVLAMLGASTWLLIRKLAIGFVCVAFFLLLAPTSSIVPLQDLAFEHRMYLSLASVVVLTAAGVWWLLQRFAARAHDDQQKARSSTRAAHITALIFLMSAVPLSMRTIARNHEYDEVLTLYAKTMEERPENPRVRINYGATLVNRGQYEPAVAPLREAVDLLRRQRARRTEGYRRALFNLASALIHTEQLEEATPLYEELHDDAPQWLLPYIQHGNALANANRHAEAAALFERAVAARRESGIEGPTLASIQFNLGNARFNLRQLDAAAAAYEQAIRINPEHARARLGLGMVLQNQGKLTDAASAYEDALRIDSSLTDAQRRLNLLRQSQP